MKTILLLLLSVSVSCLSAAEAPDPCALVTPDQLASAFGRLKGAPKPDVGIQEEKECHYENSDGNSLVIRIYSAERWGMQKGINSESNPTSLPDLGEEAFMVKKGTDKEIYIRKGNWILEIDGSADSEKLKAVAALAVIHLP